MKFIYYSMYPEDFECDEKVKRLSLEGIGFFLKCLNFAWTNDGLPPDFHDSCARAIGEDRRICNRLWPQISPNFLMAADGRLRNPRQERERKKALAVHEVKSKAAKARWERDAHAHANGYAPAYAHNMQAEQSRSESTVVVARQAAAIPNSARAGYMDSRAASMPAAAPAAAACPPENGSEPPPGLDRFESILWHASRDLILPARYVENEFGRREQNPTWTAFARAMRNAQSRILEANDPVRYARPIIQAQLRSLGWSQPGPKIQPQMAKKAAGRESA